MAEQQSPNRMTVALCGIFFGYLGLHRFLLGDVTGGIIRLFTCGGCGALGWVEGIIYLTKTDEEFYQTYVVQKKAFF